MSIETGLREDEVVEQKDCLVSEGEREAIHQETLAAVANVISEFSELRKFVGMRIYHLAKQQFENMTEAGEALGLAGKSVSGLQRVCRVTGRMLEVGESHGWAFDDVYQFVRNQVMIVIPSSEEDVLASEEKYWDLSFKELESLLKGVQFFDLMKEGLVENFFDLAPVKSLVKLADLLDHDVNYLRRMENGEARLTMNLLMKFVEKTGVTVEEMFDVPGFELELSSEEIKIWVRYQDFFEREEKLYDGMTKSELEALYQIYKEQNKIGVLIERLKFLGFLHFEVTTEKELANVLGCNDRYFRNSRLSGSLPFERVFEVIELGISAEDIFKGDEDIFGVALEDISAVLKVEQNVVEKKSKLIERFFEFFVDEDSGEQLSLSKVAQLLGCGVATLGVLKRERSDVKGYGLACSLFMKAHLNAGMKISDLLGK